MTLKKKQSNSSIQYNVRTTREKGWSKVPRNKRKIININGTDGDKRALEQISPERMKRIQE